jgi:hypothetical protein
VKQDRQRDRQTTATTTKRVNREDGWQDGGRRGRASMNIIIPFAEAALAGAENAMPPTPTVWGLLEPAAIDSLSNEPSRRTYLSRPKFAGAVRSSPRSHSSASKLPAVGAARPDWPLQGVLPRQSHERATKVSLSTPRLTHANCISILFGSDRGSLRPSNSPPCTSCCCMARSRPPAMIRF